MRTIDQIRQIPARAAIGLSGLSIAAIAIAILRTGLCGGLH